MSEMLCVDCHLKLLVTLVEMSQCMRLHVTHELYGPYHFVMLGFIMCPCVW